MTAIPNKLGPALLAGALIAAVASLAQNAAAQDGMEKSFGIAL